MAHAFLWPSKPTFHPLGDTPAISLTQDLGPEAPAGILLLGCGDPQHILFTLSTEITTNPRNVDITCCDLEPAVLARNILLITLLEAKVDIDHIWNVFYHFKIGIESSSILTRQSQRLYDASETVESWRQSSYGPFLKFSDTRTLVELRRHWKNYADFPMISSERLDKLFAEQAKLSKLVLNKHGSNILPTRAAGMFCMEAITPVNSLFQHYWETGTILAQDGATNLNPTFIYSNSGEKFNIDQMTFPQGFHLAPAMTPTIPASALGTADAIINTMKRQFADWAEAFYASRAAECITLRFHAGDAIAFCQSLDLYSRTGNTVPGLYVSEWHATQITLDAIEPSTPTSFDVIETSNLVDHLDFYNLLIGSRPLMKPRAVLYTESLLLTKRRGIERSIPDNRTYTSIPTLATLLGITPRHYISGFSSHAPDTYEDHLGQTQDRIAWVDPSSGEHHATQHQMVVHFDPEVLATALFGLYDKMFYREQVIVSVFGSRVTYSMPLHYTRGTIGSLFRIVKERVQSDWTEVGSKFIELVDKANAKYHVGGSQYVHDTKLWLHLSGVYTDPSLLETPSSARSEIFTGWEGVPPVVCVVMTVPRKHLKVLLESKDKTGIPQLEIALKSFGSDEMKHGYTSLQCVWGKLVGSSDHDSDNVRLEEDPAGVNGSSDLVVSFWASSHIIGQPKIAVALALKMSSHSEGVYKAKLAPGLVAFAAELEDREFVQVLRYRPCATSKIDLVELPPVAPSPTHTSVKVLPTLGTGPTERHVVSFTGRVDIESRDEREALVDGAEINASQVSPCAMRVAVGDFRHTLTYPYSIFGDRARIRVARKQGYIEVIVPPSEPADAGGYNLNRTPVVQNSAWNIHRISADCMPRLDTSDPAQIGWIKAHTTLQLSSSERELVLDSSKTKTPSIRAWAMVRDTIATIIDKCSGVDGSLQYQEVLLSESEGGDAHTAFLIGGFRLDLASNTVICDAAVVHPTTESLRSFMAKLPADERLQLVTSVHETAVWRKIIPAFVERCRTWNHGSNCEYTVSGMVPISIESGASPICTCGQGFGFGAPEWKVDLWADLLPSATRLALSPLFHTGPHLPSKDSISGRFGDTGPRWEFKPRTDNACWVCYGTGKPNLMTCGACKKARYCSVVCQRQDWKSHKKTCNK